jgi:hypothetical protein
MRAVFPPYNNNEEKKYENIIKIIKMMIMMNVIIQR